MQRRILTLHYLILTSIPNLPFPRISSLSWQRVTSSTQVVLPRVNDQRSANHVPHLHRDHRCIGKEVKLIHVSVYRTNVTFSWLSSSLNEALPSGPTIIFPRSPTCWNYTQMREKGWVQPQVWRGSKNRRWGKTQIRKSFLAQMWLYPLSVARTTVLSPKGVKVSPTTVNREQYNSVTSGIKVGNVTFPLQTAHRHVLNICNSHKNIVVKRKDIISTVILIIKYSHGNTSRIRSIISSVHNSDRGFGLLLIVLVTALMLLFADVSVKVVFVASVLGVGGTVNISCVFALYSAGVCACPELDQFTSVGRAVTGISQDCRG